MPYYYLEKSSTKKIDSVVAKSQVIIQNRYIIPVFFDFDRELCSFVMHSFHKEHLIEKYSFVESDIENVCKEMNGLLGFKYLLM